MFDSLNKITGILGIGRDITQRKRFEIELIQSKEKAEESDLLKTAFLANMSHEIRTPMNGILGFTELLKEPMLTGEEQKEYIDIIEKSGARMLKIINNIVSMSKIESGQMEITISETDINEQLEYVFNFFKPEAEKKNLQISYKNQIPFQKTIIKTDKEKVTAILINLVDNAIKFTTSGFIKFGYEKKANWLEFFVIDTGIGVTPDQKDLIFERFRQGSESLSRNYEGAGLGLSISKAYVELLGGKIWVDDYSDSAISNIPGKRIGSIFHFTIPDYPKQQENIAGIADTLNSSTESHIKNLKILIAEDDENSQAFISIATRPICKEMIKVDNGVKAVEACRKNPDINLVLMDIKMPEMDGYEATRQIREFNKKVIIIAQTAYGLAGDREEAIAAGCNEYVSKPINLATLNNLIKKLFT
jgi:signal transduction histidine kinase/CheY-like chemotaxis protein